MFRHGRLLLLAFVLIFLSTATYAEDTAPQSFKIPGHGSLDLQIPKTWKSAAVQPPVDLPPSITMRPPEGDAFMVRITPMPAPKPAEGVSSDAQIKRAADVIKNALAPTAVEKELVLTQLKGPAAHGYYFTATDKAPRPGEYLCMTSAVVGVGDLLLNVTILHQSKDAEEVRDAIEMLKEARLQKPDGP